MSEQQEWPAAKVTLRKASGLKAASQNSRVHPESQITAVKASIEQFGWTIPLLIDEKGTLIAGHARLQAALEMGIDKVPVMTAKGWSDDQKEAYQIADNRLSEMSSWDEDVLADQIKRISAAQIDLSFLEFELDLGAAFAPNLDPKKAGKAVSSGDMEKGQKDIDSKFAPTAGAQAYDVVCPHCGEEFKVSI